METVRADLERALARLDRLGQGGGEVAIHVSHALEAADGRFALREPIDLQRLSDVLWPPEESLRA